MSFAPAAGETMVWRERRAPPYPQLALVPALMATISAVSVTGLGIRIVLATIALSLAGLAWKLRGAGWIEDFTLTDRRLVVIRRDGTWRALPLVDLRGTSIQGARVSFRPAEGEPLVLGHVNRQARLLRALHAVAPDAAVEHRPASLCPT